MWRFRRRNGPHEDPDPAGREQKCDVKNWVHQAKAPSPRTPLLTVSEWIRKNVIKDTVFFKIS